MSEEEVDSGFDFEIMDLELEDIRAQSPSEIASRLSK